MSFLILHFTTRIFININAFPTLRTIKTTPVWQDVHFVRASFIWWRPIYLCKMEITRVPAEARNVVGLYSTAHTSKKVWRLSKLVKATTCKIVQEKDLWSYDVLSFHDICQWVKAHAGPAIFKIGQHTSWDECRVSTTARVQKITHYVLWEHVPTSWSFVRINWIFFRQNLAGRQHWCLETICNLAS